MSETLQRYLAMPPSKQTSKHVPPEFQYIFAKYCPPTPHNTTQYITSLYETMISNSLFLHPAGMGMNAGVYNLSDFQVKGGGFGLFN
jgi:hypothetical protein